MMGRALGVDIAQTRRSLQGSRRFLRDARHYRQFNQRDTFDISVRDAYPVLTEFTDEAGDVRGHYFHQDLWAARLIYERRPEKHVDIGSRIVGFVAHLLLFMPVTVVDVRPLTSEVPGLNFLQSDGANLSAIETESVLSLSCLHAIEHFGLGRYGDEINPEGPFLAMKEFARVLRPGGRLYLSTPIGRERVQFNAHRVFSPNTILSECPLDLVSFAAVDDDGRLQLDGHPSDYTDARYSCGLFEFAKN